MVGKVLFSRLFPLMRKVFAIAFLLVLFLVFLTGGLLFFLPTLVDSDLARQSLEATLSGQLRQKVEIRRISFDWQDGIMLDGCRVTAPGDTSAQPIARVQSVHLAPHWAGLLKRRLRFEFSLNGLDLHLVKDKTGRITFLPHSAAASSHKPKKMDAEKTAEQTNTKAPLQLPLDVVAGIRIQNISICFDDQAAGRTYNIKGGGIRLETASLKTRPVRMDIHAGITIDDGNPEKIDVNAVVSNLFQSDGTLAIGGISAQLHADIPGIKAVLSGDAAASGLTGDIQIDLPRVLAAVAPFMPDGFKDTVLGGNIAITARASRSKDNTLVVDGKINGSSIKAAGPILQNRSIGPADLSLAIQAQADPDAGIYQFDNIELRLQQKTFLKAGGSVHQSAGKEPAIDFTLSSARIDLNEVLALAHDFLPDQPTWAAAPDRPAFLSVDRIKAVRSASGDARIELAGLNLCPPDMMLSGNGGLVHVGQPEIRINDLSADFSENFPVAAKFSGSLSVKDVKVENGGDIIEVSGIHIDQLGINADQIRRAEAAKPGFCARFDARQALLIDRITVSDRVRIQGLAQDAALTAILFPDGALQSSLEHLAIRLNDLSLDDPRWGTISTGAALDAHVSQVSRTNAGTIDAAGVSVDLALPDLVELAVGLEARDSGKKAITASADLSLHLDKFLSLLPEPLRAQISGGGTLTVAIDASGRLPDADEIARLAKLNMENHLPFVTRVAAQIALADARVSIKTDVDHPVDIRSIIGNPVFAYAYDGNTGRGEFNSRIQISGIHAEPALIPESARCDLVISGSHLDVNTIELSQELIHRSLSGPAAAFHYRRRPGPADCRPRMGRPGDAVGKSRRPRGNRHERAGCRSRKGAGRQHFWKREHFNGNGYPAGARPEPFGQRRSGNGRFRNVRTGAVFPLLSHGRPAPGQILAD